MNKVGDYLQATSTAMHSYVKPVRALALVYGITHTVAVLGIKAWIASQKQESRTYFIERYRLQLIDQTSTIRLLLRPLTIIKALASLRSPLPSPADSQRQHSHIPTPGVTDLPTQHTPETQEPASAPAPIPGHLGAGSQKQPSDFLTGFVADFKTYYEYIPAKPLSQKKIQGILGDLQNLLGNQIQCTQRFLDQLEAEALRTVRKELMASSPSASEEELKSALRGLDIFISRTSFEPEEFQSLWKAIGIALILHRRYPDLVLDLRALCDSNNPDALKEPLTCRDLLTQVAQRKKPYDILTLIETRHSEAKPSEEILKFLSEFKSDTLPPTATSPCRSASASPAQSPSKDPTVTARVQLLGAAKKATTFEGLCTALREVLPTPEKALSLPGLPLLRWALFRPDSDNRKRVSLMTALGFMAYTLSPHVEVPGQIFSKKLPKTVPADQLLTDTANEAPGYFFLLNVGKTPQEPLLQEALASLARFKGPETERR